MEAVKCINMLTHTKDVRVAEFEMPPKSSGEVHYRSSASEYCICLEGALEVKINGGSAQSLQSGERLAIPAGAEHQIINVGPVRCQYMVVQYGGAYDCIGM